MISPLQNVGAYKKGLSTLRVWSVLQRLHDADHGKPSLSCSFMLEVCTLLLPLPAVSASVMSANHWFHLLLNLLVLWDS